MDSSGVCILACLHYSDGTKYTALSATQLVVRVCANHVVLHTTSKCTYISSGAGSGGYELHPPSTACGTAMWHLLQERRGERERERPQGAWMTRIESSTAVVHNMHPPKKSRQTHTHTHTITPTERQRQAERERERAESASGPSASSAQLYKYICTIC